MSPLDNAIDIAGGTAALARALEVTPQVVSNWKKRGVPAEYCRAVEAAVGSSVTRYELRPDVFGSAPDSMPREAYDPNQPARAAAADGEAHPAITDAARCPVQQRAA